MPLTSSLEAEDLPQMIQAEPDALAETTASTDPPIPAVTSPAPATTPTPTPATPATPPATSTGPPQQPKTTTDVDDPSHPLYRHRRTVADFEYGPILGEGSYSTVLVGRDKNTGAYYAVKKLDKAHIVQNDKVKYVMIERDALSKMNHPSIVRLYWTFKDSRSLYYVLDLARNGELYTYIRRLAPFDLDTTRFYAAEILVAIEHIHSRGVIHRDIKPENILIDDNMHVKITDFGSAKILQPGSDDEGNEGVGRSRSFVGTAEYVSPELLKSEPTRDEADLWALGCVIYQMLVGKSPFKAATDYLIFQKIKNLEYTFPDEFPEVARDIVQNLLQLDPNERLGSRQSGGTEVLRQHPFFEGIDWDHLFESKAPPLKERLDEKLKEIRQRTPAENELDMCFDTADENPFSDQPSIPDSSDDDDDDSIGQPPPSGMRPIPSAYHHHQHHQHHHHRHPSTSYPSSPIHHSRNPSSSSSSHAPMRPSSTSQSSTLDRLGEQSHPPWISHLFPNESIVHAGLVLRRRAFFSKKRFLILTNRPRLLYMDEGSAPDGSGGTLRGEIAWTPQLLPELKTKSQFCIRTPQKSFTFEDPKGQAQEWVNIINSMLVDSFGVAA